LTRAIRPLLIVLAVFVGLIVVAAIALKLFVDPNDYRDRIERGAESAVGRKVELEGRLKLALWPRIAVRTGPISVANARGFGQDPMATAADARVNVAIWPLLQRRLEIGRVEVDGPRIRLQVDRAGRNNWSGLFEKPATAEPAAAEGASTIRSTAIQGLRVRDGVLSFDDRHSDAHYEISGLSLDVGALGSSEPVPIETSFALTTEPGKPPRRVQLDALVARMSPTSWGVRKLRCELGTAADGDAKAPTIVCDVPELTYDTDRHLLAVPQLALSVAGARLQGALSGTVGEPATALSGSLRLEPTKPKDLLRAFGVEAPKAADARALESLQFDSKLAYGPRGLALDAINGRLDATTFRGSLRLPSGTDAAIDFRLDLDEIDVDRYLPPSDAPAKSAPAGQKTADSPSTLRATGRFTAGRMRAYGLDMQKVQAAVRLNGARLRLDPLQLRVFDGDAITRVTYDASQPTRTLDVDLRVSRVEIAPLLRQFLKDDRLSGRGSLTTRVTGRGATSDALIASFAGPFEVGLVDGSYAGVDLWNEIERALATAQGRAPPARSANPRTPFDRFSANGRLNGTVLDVQRFDLANAFLTARGRGQVEYKQTTCDLDLVARLLKAPEGSVAGLELERLTGVDIGVTVKGPLNDPKVRPDVGHLLEAIAKQRLRKEGEKVEEKLKDKLQDKIRGLLGQ
jgi:AsmA protein